MADDAVQYLRVEQIAFMFNLTVRRVQQLVQEGIIKSVEVPGVQYRRYPFPETVQTYVAYLQKKAGGKGDRAEALDVAKLAEMDLRRRKLEAQVRVVEGEVHAGIDVKLVMSDMLNSIKVRLRGLPSDLANKLEGAPDRNSIVRIATDEIEQTCKLMSEYSPDLFYAHNPDYIEFEDDVTQEESAEN